MKWSTRTISTYIAATVPMEKAGDVNPLLESAQKIGLEDQQNDEETAAAKPEPKTNSYEAFMATFGSPARWAGRS